MAHDFLGNELGVGDDVVFLNYNGTSASLERGKITRVSEHTAEISGKRRAEYKIIKVNPVKPTCEIWHGGHLETDFCSYGRIREVGK